MVINWGNMRQYSQAGNAVRASVALNAAWLTRGGPRKDTVIIFVRDKKTPLLAALEMKGNGWLCFLLRVDGKQRWKKCEIINVVVGPLFYNALYRINYRLTNIAEIVAVGIYSVVSIVSIHFCAMKSQL